MLPQELQPLCDRNALEINEQDWRKPRHAGKGFRSGGRLLSQHRKRGEAIVNTNEGFVGCGARRTGRLYNYLTSKQKAGAA
jgi:hypothetical protein